MMRGLEQAQDDDLAHASTAEAQSTEAAQSAAGRRWINERRQALRYEDPVMCATCQHISLGIGDDGRPSAGQQYPVMCSIGRFAVSFVGRCDRWTYQDIEEQQPIAISNENVSFSPKQQGYSA